MKPRRPPEIKDQKTNNDILPRDTEEILQTKDEEKLQEVFMPTEEEFKNMQNKVGGIEAKFQQYMDLPETVNTIKQGIEELNQKEEIMAGEKGDAAPQGFDPIRVTQAVSAMEQLIERDKKRQTDEQIRVDRADQVKLVKESVREEIKKTFCLPDGSMCFNTKEELDAAIKKLEASISDQLKAGIGEIQEAVKSANDAITKTKEEKPESIKEPLKGKEETKVIEKKEISEPPPPPGELGIRVKPLTEMTAKTREGYDEKENLTRDLEVQGAMEKLNITYMDVFRQIKASPIDWKALMEKVAGDMGLKDHLNACVVGDEDACKIAIEEFKSDKKWRPVLKEFANKVF